MLRLISRGRYHKQCWCYSAKKSEGKSIGPHRLARILAVALYVVAVAQHNNLPMKHTAGIDY